MKKIRIKICSYNPEDKLSYGRFLFDILQKYYEVELTDDPDYVFCHESSYEYLNYDCVRIFYTGENFTPNFNLFDYAIGYDYLTFGDRYFRMPMYLVALYYNAPELLLAGGMDFTKQKPFTREELANKKAFCSFVYSNYMANPEREEIFRKLSAYKKVDAGGAYMNNVGGRVKNKLAFEMEHKFSIAFENSSSSGYSTEKLPNALMARTIPIFWGNPDIGLEFNEKRFINCHAYKNLDEVVEKVKELDQNDELYLKMVNEPVAANGFDFKAIRDNFEKYLCHIFDQPLEQARRRKISLARAAILERGERLVGSSIKRNDAARKFLAKLYQPFKKISVIDKMKQKVLAGKIRKKAGV